MSDMDETPEEAQYTLGEIEHMDKCGVLPKDFKAMKDYANTQFDAIHWPSFFAGIEAGAAQCMENLGTEITLTDSMRKDIYLVMKSHESSEFRGHHLRKLTELIVGIISSTIDPKNVK